MHLGAVVGGARAGRRRLRADDDLAVDRDAAGFDRVINLANLEVRARDAGRIADVDARVARGEFVGSDVAEGVERDDRAVEPRRLGREVDRRLGVREIGAEVGAEMAERR